MSCVLDSSSCTEGSPEQAAVVAHDCRQPVLAQGLGSHLALVRGRAHGSVSLVLLLRLGLEDLSEVLTRKNDNNISSYQLRPPGS